MRRHGTTDEVVVVDVHHSSRSVTVPILRDQGTPSRGCSVDDLLLTIQRQVRHVREKHPEFSESHLDDVSLSVSNGELLAKLLFRE